MFFLLRIVSILMFANLASGFFFGGGGGGGCGCQPAVAPACPPPVAPSPCSGGGGGGIVSGYVGAPQPSFYQPAPVVNYNNGGGGVGGAGYQQAPQNYGPPPPPLSPVSSQNYLQQGGSGGYQQALSQPPPPPPPPQQLPEQPPAGVYQETQVPSAVPREEINYQPSTETNNASPVALDVSQTISEIETQAGAAAAASAAASKVAEVVEIVEVDEKKQELTKSSKSTGSSLNDDRTTTSEAIQSTEFPIGEELIPDTDDKEVDISELHLTDDPLCNSEDLRKIVIDNIDNQLNSSKRMIQLAAEAHFGGRFDVICANGDFSYVTNTELYCQETKSDISCYTYRQL